MKPEIKAAAERLHAERKPLMPLSAWLAYVDNIVLDTKDVNERSMEDAVESYYGEYSSTAEFGEYVADNNGLVDDIRTSPLANYIDFHAFGKDLILGGDYWVNNGHYFLSR